MNNRPTGRSLLALAATSHQLGTCAALATDGCRAEVAVGFTAPIGKAAASSFAVSRPPALGAGVSRSPMVAEASYR